MKCADTTLVDITPNPYLAFGLRLGRDEVNAWVLSAAATGIASLLLRWLGGDLTAAVRAAILAVVGPLAEKPGLLLAYFRQALADYRAAPLGARAPRRHYIRQAIRAGWPTLVT